MSIKHVKEYYNEVSSQYHEFNENLQELEVQVQKGMASPELMEKLKEMIAPLKNNWMTLNYIIFLLNKPNKKPKQARYELQNKKLLEQCKQKQEILKENDLAIKKLKEIKIT